MENEPDTTVEAAETSEVADDSIRKEKKKKKKKDKDQERQEE